jgi:hypothetical protein
MEHISLKLYFLIGTSFLGVFEILSQIGVWKYIGAFFVAPIQ